MRNLWKSAVVVAAISASLSTGLAGGSTVGSGIYRQANSLSSHFRDNVVIPPVIDPHHMTGAAKPNLANSNCYPYPVGGPDNPDWSTCVDLLASQIGISDCYPLDGRNEAGLIFYACQKWFASQEVAPPPPTGAFAVVNSKGSVSIDFNRSINIGVSISVQPVAGRKCVDDDGRSCTFTHLPSGIPLWFYVTASNEWGRSSAPLGPVIAEKPKRPYLVAVSSVVALGEQVQVLEVGNDGASPSSLALGGKVIGCASAALSQCIYSTTFSKSGVYKGALTDGKNSLAISIWVVGVSYPSSVVAGKSLKVTVTNSQPNKLVAVTLDNGGYLFGGKAPTATARANGKGNAIITILMPKALAGLSFGMSVTCNGVARSDHLIHIS